MTAALPGEIEIRRDLVDTPVFSVCIPQHNRTSFLIEACASLASQTFTQFEVCISDDCSTDGRQGELLEFLHASSLSFVYRRQSRNLQYDGNLRASIGLARGEFSFLLGNDDYLTRSSTLGEIYSRISAAGCVSAVVSNYEDFGSGERVARVSRSGIVGHGPGVAVRSFRNFSFLSGLILRTSCAHEHATSRWDGSEMYQMYLATRMIAAGGALLYVDLSAVRKDIQIEGQSVDSYAARPRLDPCPIVERHLPLGRIGQLVADAIGPYAAPSRRGRLVERIARQLYAYTYPFWIVEYRRVQSRRFALGVCLGLRPRHSLAGLDLSAAARVRLSVLFWVSSLAALTLPAPMFELLRGSLYRAAKATT
jgi:hypothetical protein